MHIRIYISILLISLLTALIGCESDYSYRGNSSSIRFSADTLSFDTIFTGEATTTTSLRIYNVSGEDMTIDRIWLQGASSSAFHVNIDGVNKTELTDIRIRKGDSLFVFVNVLPRITNDFIYRLDDDIHVQAGSNKWTSHLQAFGMNAIRVSGRIARNTTWTAEKPYLLSGNVSVDKNATLTVNEGTQIFMSEKAQLDVYGRLITQGTRDNMVKISTARLDKFYSDIPGQWGSIYLQLGTGRAELSYTEIINATHGVLADSLCELSLDGVIIHDASKNAVVTYASKTSINNSILYNCGESLIAVYGGDVEVIHSTLSNHYRWASRVSPSLLVYSHTDTPSTDTTKVAVDYPELISFVMANSVVCGTNKDELEFNDAITESNCLISHSYLRLGTKWKESSDSRFDAVIVGKDPEYVDRAAFDFHPSAISELVGKASRDYAQKAPSDFDGNDRTNGNPDIGALQHSNATEEKK